MGLVPVASALLLLCCFTAWNAAAADASGGGGGLRLNYYSESCPRAEQIVKEQVRSLYEEHGNTAVSWLRALFHDCTVKSCDASLLLETDAARGLVSEQASPRSFGMRNFKYVGAIKRGHRLLRGPPRAGRPGRRGHAGRAGADRDAHGAAGRHGEPLRRGGAVHPEPQRHGVGGAVPVRGHGAGRRGRGGAAGRALGGPRPLQQPGGEAVPGGGRRHRAGLRRVPAGPVPDGGREGGHPRRGVRAQRPRHAHGARQHVPQEPAERPGAPARGPAARVRPAHGAVREEDGRRQRVLPRDVRGGAGEDVRERAAHRRAGGGQEGLQVRQQ